jgi:ribosomal protein L24
VNRKQTKCPTPNSRISNGCTVLVTGGSLKGQRGKALLLSGSMWMVLFGEEKVTLHRTCLRRVQEGQVAV